MSQKTIGFAAICCGFVLALIGVIGLMVGSRAAASSIVSFSREGTEFSFECLATGDRYWDTINLYHDTNDATCMGQYQATTVTFSNVTGNTPADLKDTTFGTMKDNCTGQLRQREYVARRLAGADDISTKQGFAEFMMYYEHVCKPDGACEFLCVPGKYEIKSTNEKTIYAISLKDKVGDVVGGLGAILGVGLGMVALCCCGLCASCLGVFLLVTAPSPQAQMQGGLPQVQQKMPQVQMQAQPYR